MSYRLALITRGIGNGKAERPICRLERRKHVFHRNRLPAPQTARLHVSTKPVQPLSQSRGPYLFGYSFSPFRYTQSHDFSSQC
jgi:hypothetical protein